MGSIGHYWYPSLNGNCRWQCQPTLKVMRLASSSFLMDVVNLLRMPDKPYNTIKGDMDKGWWVNVEVMHQHRDQVRRRLLAIKSISCFKEGAIWCRGVNPYRLGIARGPVVTDSVEEMAQQEINTHSPMLYRTQNNYTCKRYFKLGGYKKHIYCTHKNT